MRKHRKNYTPQEKVFILKRHLVDRIPVSDFCDQYNLQPNVFYRWQKEFFENRASAFDKTIVGWAVHEEESERYSRDLFERTLQGRKIALRALHADNGHPMKGISLISLLTSLNVEISHNRPRVSNDNPFIESLFKTLKYQVDYPLRFRDLIHAREWMASFESW